MYTNRLFTLTVYISAALTAAVLFSVSAYILINLPVIADKSGQAEAAIGLTATVIVLLCFAYALRSLLRCGRTEGGFDMPRGNRSGLGAVGWTLPLMWAVSVAYILFVTLLGADLGGSFMDDIPHETLAAELMFAGPEEEIIFRAL